MAFASLLLETAYSFSGATIMLEPLIERAKKEGYDTLVLTDKKMHLHYKFYYACRKEKIQPVLGLQIYLEPLLSGRYIHVACYAQNELGYKNLLKLSSLQSINQPLSHDVFQAHAKHLSLVVLPTEEDGLEAYSEALLYKTFTDKIKRFSDHVYAGVNDKHKPPTDALPMLFIDRVSVLHAFEAPHGNRLQMILQKEETRKITSEEAFKSLHFFDTIASSDRQQLAQFLQKHVFDMKPYEANLPAFKNEHGLKSVKYLRALSEKGLEKRLRSKNVNREVYQNRLKSELDVIHEMGYDDYFLIVYDVCRQAIRSGILVGPGRGSAPGSLVAYALGITHVDPVKYGLLFERFLNKARGTMPDIDIDFPDHAREQIINYTKERYGKDYVSHICTFGTFLKKSALRDSARLFELEKRHLEEMVKKIEHYHDIETMIEEDLDVQNRMENNDNIEVWLETAAAIEGLPKHISTHAAGIVLSDIPLVEYTAIQAGINELHQTQYPQGDLEAMGLLKMDFLGLANLAMIEDIIKLIDQDHHQKIDVYSISLNDQETFKFLRDKSVTGIFQLESSGMRQLIRDMQVQSFEDIFTILALFRPGPMQSIKTYLKRRFKQESITYPAEELAPILASTEGILLYQEQIMAIASKFAGYTLNEADLLRRAVSKKDAEILTNERERFVAKAVKNGKEASVAKDIYKYIVTFANYGFNKSHSVAYAVIAYWMAYLKTHYPAQFVAVLMQTALANESLMSTYRQEAMQLGITVLPPSINRSSNRFVNQNKQLIYPLLGIKNIGKKVVTDILQVRGDTPFKDFTDFIGRTHEYLNLRHYRMLIYAGACDEFTVNRHTMIEHLDALQHYINYQGLQAIDDFVFTKKEEYEETILQKQEKEALGMNIAYDTWQKVLAQYHRHNVRIPSEVNEPTQNYVKILAKLVRIKTITTKKNDLMAFITLEDHKTTMDAVCFPTTYAKFENHLKVGAYAMLEGHVQEKNQQLQLVIDKLELLTIQKDI